jgi:phage terminase Nu1 subunit (DNA packaging protein)
MTSKVNGTALAAHLGCTRETVNDYVKRGIIAKLSDGMYDQDKCRLKVFAHLRGLSAGRTGSGDKSLSEARAELTRQQTEAVALKNAVTRGELVRLATVQRSAEIIFAAFRERCLSVPGKIAAICEMRSRSEVEETVRAEIYECLEELSGPILPVDGAPMKDGSDAAVGHAEEEEII